MSEFASWLHTAIQARGWQPADLASALDVDPSLVSRWLNGKAKPSRRMTAKLCILFRVSADWLLPIIDYDDVTGMAEPQQRNEQAAELLSRLPALTHLLELVMRLPVEKQLTYIEMMVNLLPGLDRKG